MLTKRSSGFAEVLGFLKYYVSKIFRRDNSTLQLTRKQLSSTLSLIKNETREETG